MLACPRSPFGHDTLYRLEQPMDSAQLTLAPRRPFDEMGSISVAEPKYQRHEDAHRDCSEFALNSGQDFGPNRNSDIRPEELKISEDIARPRKRRSRFRVWLAEHASPIRMNLPPLVTGAVAVAIAGRVFQWPTSFGLFYVAGMCVCTFHNIVFGQRYEVSSRARNVTTI